MELGTTASIRAVLATGLLALASGCATAQEITLKGVNAFQEGTYPARGFEIFVKKLNAAGKGVMQIQYLGGPKSMPAAEHATALKSGVIDIANTTASYTANLVPEGMALSFSPLRTDALRRDGAMQYLNDLYLEKGLYYLGRTYPEGIQYHIFTNKRIDRVDLTGQKLRIAAVYRDFFQALGATVVQTAPGEVYTALERGVVDGFGWPLMGIFDLSWQEKVKYRIDPGFYSVEAGMVMSASTWQKLTPTQRTFLETQVREFEAENTARAQADVASEMKRLQEAGIQTITLAPNDAKRFIEIANDNAWDGLVKLSPKHGAKLRQLMSGK